MKHKPFLSVLFILLFLLGTGFLSFSFFLPRYIERNILPDLGSQLSSSLSGRVYSIGLSSADFGDIYLGDRQNPALSIGLIHTDYSLSSLRTGKLGLISIDGLRLNLKYSDDTLIIPGLDLEKLSSQQSSQLSSEQSDTISLPILPESFQVRNGLITFSYEEEFFLIPFNLEATKQGQEDVASVPLYSFVLQMLPQGENISLEGHVDLATNKADISCTAPSVELNRFLNIAGLTSGMISTGKGSFRARTRISLLPFQFEEAKVTGDFEPILFRQVAISFGPATKTPDQEAPISLDLRYEREQWLLNVRAAVSEPFDASLELNSSTAEKEEQLHSSGSFIFRPMAQSDQNQQSRFTQIVKDFPELQGDFVIDLNKSGVWQATINSTAKVPNRQTEDLHMQFKNAGLKTGMPTLSLQGRGDGRKDELDLSLSIPELQVRYDDAAVRIPLVNLLAAYRRNRVPDQAESAPLGQGTLSITLNDTQFNRQGLSARADISLQGNMKQQVTGGAGSFQTGGTVTINNGEIIDSDNSITVKTIAGKIPWQWPVTDKETFGEIKAADISVGSYDLGAFLGDLRLKEMTYSLTGSHTGSLMPEIITRISGKAELTGSGLQGEIAAHIDPTPLSSLHLGKFHSALNNAYFSGVLGLESFLRFNPAGIQGRVDGRVQQGRFEMPEKKYVVEDLDLSFVLPALPDLRSSPAQKIIIKRASAGDLVLEDGKIIWQLEPPDTILIEESRFRWAGGRIFTNAVRVSPDMKDLAITIFCDRLKLADLLEQFGVSNAQGGGTVSGRIPLTVSSKTIHFEDGFLYSSPGQGGSVRVAAFDTLAAGIPKNTPQFAQVDFAAEALKNFSYNWVKLLFNTEGEELVMQMQMDGKPVQSLPFRYDSRTGMLQRIEDGSQGINQAIRLDVNFRLPLNRFLGYSGRIQDIMDKIK